jgi:hypothetical protein
MLGASSLNAFPSLLPNEERTTRMFEGKVVFALGVAGSTLIEVCGDRVVLLVGVWIVSMLLEEIEEALLWVW